MKVDELKEQARRHEQREEWQKALDLYHAALRQQEEDDAPDITLFNRVGDIHTRLGQTSGAVAHYERAIDLYIEAELPNNAIAICKKVLRHLPDRVGFFLRMGKIRAAQGFLTDARHSFLTFAERATAVGDTEAALNALIEFVDISPDDLEIRLALASQLESHGKEEEAVDQYAEAYRRMILKGDDEEAGAIAEKIGELAPDLVLSDPEAIREESEDAAPQELVVESTSLADLELKSWASEEEESAIAGASADAFETETIEEGLADREGSVAGGEEGQAEKGAAPFDGFGAVDLPEMESYGEGGELDLEEADEGAGEDAEDEDAEDEDSDSLPTFDFEFEEEEEDEEPEPLPILQFDDEEPDEEDSGEGELEAEGLDEEDFGEGEISEEALAEEDSGKREIDGEELIDEEIALEEPDEEQRELPPERAREEAFEDAGAEAGFDRPSAPPLEPSRDPALEESTEEETATALEEGPEEETATALEEGPEEETAPLLPVDHRRAAERGDLALAIDMVRVLIQSEPDELEHYQRLVEYAFRTGDNALLVSAYVDLADCLLRTGAPAKARAVFQQVLSLSPAHPEALAGIRQLDGVPAADAPVEVASSEEYVDLGALILGDDREKTTRWKVAADAPSGDEDADFARMLTQFKEKVSEHVASDDVSAHHDLGTAYMEMGLLDEAIGEFQMALRASPSHLPTHEVMGRCWMEMGESEMAVRSLTRALDVECEIEDELLGIYYLIGRAHERLGNRVEAVEFYEKVFSLDINFQDVTERLRALR